MKKEFLLGMSAAFCIMSAQGSEPAQLHSDAFKKDVRKEVEKIAKTRGWVDLHLSPNQAIAFEIADKNPHAAIVFTSLYDDVPPPLPEKGPMFFTLGDIDLDSETAIIFIKKYAAREKVEEPAKKSNHRVFAEYEIRRTTGGMGYLNIEMYKADEKDREIEKMLPNIRVNLKRIGGDGDGGHWEAIGWQTY